MMHHCLTMTALALSVAATAAYAADPAPVRVDGAVLHPQSFSLADLQALPPAEVTTSFGTQHGEVHKSWTGALLLDLVQKAGLKNEAGKNASLRHSFVVHGKDGYEVALAMGEIDSMGEGKRVILAYRDTAGLPGFRLVIPGDIHGARQVHDVVEIEVR
jgi:hypothetical protein